MSDNLFWADLEATNFDMSRKDFQILEVGVVITDSKLNKLEEFQQVIPFDINLSKTLDPVVINMHTKNGLFNECDALFKTGVSFNDRIESIEIQLIKLIEKYNISKKTPLCGSSIGGDRNWMTRDLKGVMDRISYRNIDVSSLMEFAQRQGINISKGFSTGHRVLEDIYNSILKLKLYWNKIAQSNLTI